MSKMVFICLPAHGLVNPTLAVVQELAQRGAGLILDKHLAQQPFTADDLRQAADEIQAYLAAI